MNGGVYGCSQRIEGKEGTGPPAECHAVFPGRLQSRLAGRGGFPADMPAGRDRPAAGLLAGAVPLVLCLLVELLNSAIENVVDRISLEWHPLAKKAKDMGSAAQFTAQLFLAAVWGGYLLGRL